MAIEIEHSSAPIGSAVRGIALQDVTDADFVRLRALVHARGVVAVRGQDLSELAQIAFARRFGELQKIFIQEALSPEHPELFFVSNIIENGRPKGSMDAGRYWHTDGAYLARPHNVSMLYAIEVPRRDDGVPLGDTDFVGMAAAYDALSDAMKQRIEGLRAVHDVNFRYTRSASGADFLRRTSAFAPASHPLAIRHPDTGRRCLYLSEGYTSSIEGLPPDEGEALLESLRGHVLRPEFQYRHVWQEGDLLIWDNRATLHRATFDYALPKRRLMRRATVAGEALG